MTFTIERSRTFAEWFNALRDLRAARRIQLRIDRLELGLFGDVKRFDGIGELRIDYGLGYRVYFVQRGTRLIVLLAGGTKNTQARDILTAKRMAREI